MLLTTACGPRDKLVLDSKILEESRTVFIRLPAGYETSNSRWYPVLYILDGHRLIQSPYKKPFDDMALSDELPPVIMVGIANRAGFATSSRNRDFDPEEGGAERFQGFLRSELVPFIDARFRTQSCRLLLGHSSAGLFTVYSLFCDPGLFTGYIVSCPALISDGKLIAELAERWTGSRPLRTSFLYLAVGDRDFSGFITSAEALASRLDEADPEALSWEYHLYPGGDHITTPQLAFYDGAVAFFRRELCQPVRVDNKH